MKTSLALLLGLLVALALPGCPKPSPAPTPTPVDASDGGTYASICAHLAHLPSGESCSEGVDPNCPHALELLVSSSNVDLPCLSGASSASSAKACKGGITCAAPAPPASSKK